MERLSRSEKINLRIIDIFREELLAEWMEQIFKLSKLKGATVATVTAAMVDKSPKFLKSTPTFPRELKMGIFALSEKGEIFGGGKLRQFWQWRGGDFPAWGWEHSDLLAAEWMNIWPVSDMTWNAKMLEMNPQWPGWQRKTFLPTSLWGKTLTNGSPRLQQESASQIWQFATAVTSGKLLLKTNILIFRAISIVICLPWTILLHQVYIPFLSRALWCCWWSQCLPRGFSTNRLSSTQWPAFGWRVTSVGIDSNQLSLLI